LRFGITALKLLYSYTGKITYLYKHFDYRRISGLSNLCYKKLIGAGKLVLGYSTDVFWLDMGNKDDYERGIKEFEQNCSAFRIDD
jgi:NDP-sugar pyrophosphorylase family protein